MNMHTFVPYSRLNLEGLDISNALIDASNGTKHSLHDGIAYTPWCVRCRFTSAEDSSYIVEVAEYLGPCKFKLCSQ